MFATSKKPARRNESGQLNDGELTMPFLLQCQGDKPEDGRSLYISLHGGGGTTKQVNDSQWNNQKKLYQVPEGVYLAPCAPTDAWNMWHQGHIDGMFDRLIENLIVFKDVNPNRVYLLGYSAGGDGVYQLAPRMADRWAAASMMAGHPEQCASPVNFYNTPFTIHVGAKDGAYNRNKVALNGVKNLMSCKKRNRPVIFTGQRFTKVRDTGWIMGRPRPCRGWLNTRRNPLPKDIIWRQDKHKRFYWLATDKLHPGAVVRATLNGQTIDMQPGGQTSWHSAQRPDAGSGQGYHRTSEGKELSRDGRTEQSQRCQKRLPNAAIRPRFSAPRLLLSLREHNDPNKNRANVTGYDTGYIGKWHLYSNQTG